MDIDLWICKVPPFVEFLADRVNFEADHGQMVYPTGSVRITQPVLQRRHGWTHACTLGEKRLSRFESHSPRFANRLQHLLAIPRQFRPADAADIRERIQR